MQRLLVHCHFLVFQLDLYGYYGTHSVGKLVRIGHCMWEVYILRESRLPARNLPTTGSKLIKSCRGRGVMIVIIVIIVIIAAIPVTRARCRS